MAVIAPPSIEVLRERLTGRGTEEADVIAKRVAEAEKEMECINDQIEMMRRKDGKFENVDPFPFLHKKGDGIPPRLPFQFLFSESRKKTKKQKRKFKIPNSSINDNNEPFTVSCDDIIIHFE